VYKKKEASREKSSILIKTKEGAFFKERNGY